MDLTHYLWKAYKAAPDEEFNACIKYMKSQTVDGRATFNADQLMAMAENKYGACLLDEDNEWGKLSDEQEQIIAMNAKINAPRTTTARIQLPRATTNKASKISLP